MSAILGRRARVHINTVGDTKGLVIDSLPPDNDGQAGLRIVFRAEKTLDAKPNKLELGIYNLAPSSRARLPTGKSVAVELEAGYKTDLGLIFKGDIRRVWEAHETPNVITNVSSGDGDIALRTARLNASFAPTTKLADVLTKMVDGFGLKADSAKQRIRKGDFRGGIQELVNGFSFSGPLQQEFDRQMRAAGLTWSVQNGEVQVLGQTEALQTQALRISPTSGLIGSPERLSSSDKNDDKVLRFRCLLNADIRPGRLVVLDSLDFPKTTLRVRKVVCQGDTWGENPMFCEVEGDPLIGKSIASSTTIARTA